MELLDLILTALVAGGGAYFGSYLKKKGENLATHEDIDKLVKQVSGVTEATKQIEARISNDTWRRQRKSELQLKTIESVNMLSSEFINRSIADAAYVPPEEWFTGFSAADCAVKALFDDATYHAFKQMEVLIGPPLESVQQPGPEGAPGSLSVIAVDSFIGKRNAAIKAMYQQVLE